MTEDPIEDEVKTTSLEESVENDIEHIEGMQPIDKWPQFRQEMVVDMFNMLHS